MAVAAEIRDCARRGEELRRWIERLRLGRRLAPALLRRVQRGSVSITVAELPISSVSLTIG